MIGLRTKIGVSVASGGKIAIPNAPSAFTATQSTDVELILNWTNNAPSQDGIKIERSYDNITWTQIGTTLGSTATYTDSTCLRDWTHYYRLRSYKGATNNSEYSSVANATTKAMIDASGNIYTAINVGHQRWLLQDIRTAKYADGTDIISGDVDATWAANTSGCYHNWGTNPAPYGFWYNGYLIRRIYNAKKIAMTGWQVPRRVDVAELILKAGTNPGYKLREAGTSHWQSGANVTNATGMTLLGVGNKSSTGSISNVRYAYSMGNQEGTSNGTTYYNYCDIYDGLFNEATTTISVGFCVRLIRCYPTVVEIDKHLADLVIYFTANAPAANETFTFNTNEYGKPTGGAANTNLVAVQALFTAQSKTATFLINT